MATSNQDIDKTSCSYSDSLDSSNNLICVPCHRDKPAIPQQAYGYCIDCGEHLCAACHHIHQRPSPCRHHRLQDQTSMPTIQHISDMSAAVDTGPVDDLSTPCKHHRTETIKLYCNDHKSLLCSMCIAFKHTQCQVDYIPDVSTKCLNSKTLQETLKRIDNLENECREIKTRIVTDTAKTNYSLKQALIDVQKYRQTINRKIDELENEIKNQIKLLQQQNDDQLKQVDTICTDIQKIISSTRDNMTQQNTSYMANQLFIELQTAKTMMKEFSYKINSIKHQRHNQYMFIPSSQVDDLLKVDKAGEVVSKPFWLTPTSKMRMNVQTSEDKETCCITGMTMLSSDKLLLSDFINNSVKLFDIKSSTVLSQLILGTMSHDSPQHITAVSDTEVAVTIPGRQKIKVLTVSDNLSLTLFYDINIDGQCYGICRYDDKLFVTYRLWGEICIQILDINDNMKVIAKLSNRLSGESRRDKSCYVQANKDYIYVSLTKSIIKMNWKGDVIAKYTDMVRPVGLALLTDGSLLVCDLEGHIVSQLSEDFKMKRDILQDVVDPRVIYVAREHNKLYISINKRRVMSRFKAGNSGDQNKLLVWDI